MIEFYKYLSKIYPRNGKANQTCPHVQYERQVFWILGYFTNFKFLPFRHFTIIKNISQLNVRHAFQASYPSTIVPPSLNLIFVQVSKYTWTNFLDIPRKLDNRCPVNFTLAKFQWTDFKFDMKMWDLKRCVVITRWT